MKLLSGCFHGGSSFDSNSFTDRAVAFSKRDVSSNEVRTKIDQSDLWTIVSTYHSSSQSPPIFYEAQGEKTLSATGFFISSKQNSSSQLACLDCTFFSDKDLEQQEGEFVAVLSDKSQRALHIVNDRFASRPFFIAKQGKSLFFSSNITFLALLLNRHHQPDPQGWLQIFTLGHTIGKRTNLEGISRLLPASNIRISGEGVKEKQYWRLKYEPVLDLSPDYYAKKVFNSLRSSVTSRTALPGECVLALSGGLDSRVIAGALPSGHDIEAFTFCDQNGGTNPLEVNTAQSVAKAIRIPHTVTTLAPNRTSNVAPALILRNGGLTPIHHGAKTMAILSHLKERGKSILIGGGPGNNLSGDLSVPWKSDGTTPTSEEAITHFVQSKLSTLKTEGSPLRSLFKADFLESECPVMEEELLHSFSLVSGETLPHLSSGWEMMVGFPAFSANSPVHSDGEIIDASAHLGYAYTDLMLKLPATWLEGRCFYIHLIVTSCPDLADIVYANTGQCLASNALDLSAASNQAIAAPKNKLSKSQGSLCFNLPRKVLAKLMRSKRSVSALETTLRSDGDLFNDLMNTLSKRDLAGSFLDVEKCIDAAKQFFHAGPNYRYRSTSPPQFISSLATLGYVLETGL